MVTISNARRRWGTVPAALLPLTLLACGPAAPADDPIDVSAALSATPPPIDARKELLITDLSVIEDPSRTVSRATPDAAWSFGRLISGIAHTPDPSRFILAMMRTWERDQSLNGRLTPARPPMRSLVINPWLAASGCATCQPSATDDCAASDDRCALDYSKQPFRLLAIVNRPDLRKIGSDARRTAGEGRFVFGVLGLDATTGRQDRVLQFTVILEYELPGTDPGAVRSWAKSWHELGTKPFGKSFNDALAGVTKRFTDAVCKDKPAGSCINQIRTNEASLDPTRVWQLREFRFDGAGNFGPSVVAQTPADDLNGQAALADLVNANATALIAGKDVIPAQWKSGHTSVPQEGFVWNAPGITDGDARHGLAVNTCNGCHGNETGTRFTHIKPRAAGAPTVLSAFLTGIDPATGLPATVTDPVTGVPRSFAELASRAADLQFVLTATDAELGGKPPKHKPD